MDRITRRLAGYWRFSRRCMAALVNEHRTFSLFVALSTLAALTEGLSVTLLAPILEPQLGGSSFAGVPIFGRIAGLFADFSPDGRIAIAAVLMAVIVASRGALLGCTEYLNAMVPLRIERNLNVRSYDALMAAQLEFIQRNEYGTLSNAAGGWAQRVSIALSSVGTILSSFMVILVYVALMVAISWKLTALAVAFFAALFLAQRSLTSPALLRAGRRYSVAMMRFNQAIMEGISGAKVVRLTTAEGLMNDRFKETAGEVYSSQLAVARVQAVISPLNVTCAGLFICVLLFANAVFNNSPPSVWIGSILIFLLLLLRLTGPVSNINLARVRVLKHINGFELLDQFYADAEKERQPSGHAPVTPLRHALTFENVDFSYRTREAPALREISATIEACSVVGVVGPSGAGKSTLIGLVTRLYDPDRGRVCADGVDLRDFGIREWRRRLAVVIQDTFIFNDTVANNIRFGLGDVPMEHVREAALFASADEFIESLPQGYDTMLGDRGVRISGGQQQRIAIARAILVKPDILILDEATSHLDTVTERAIQQAIERMSRQCTLIIIAHRLSTIRKADKIIVLDQGRLVEEGKHSELLERRSIYWHMIEHQRLDLDPDDSRPEPTTVRA